MQRPRKRLTVGLMMLLVAVAALAVWAFEYSRRIQVVLDNRSPLPVQNVTVTYAGRVQELGPVEPRTRSTWRIPAPAEQAVRVAWDVRDDQPGKSRRIEAPPLSASAPGAAIIIQWDGK